MILSKSKGKINLLIYNHRVEQTDCVIDSRLTWKQHVRRDLSKRRFSRDFESGEISLFVKQHKILKVFFCD